MKCQLIGECQNEVKDSRWAGCCKDHTWRIKQRAITMQDAFSANKSNADMEWYNICRSRDSKSNWSKPPRLDFTVEEAVVYGKFVK
jgi:hypothetical protein